MPEARVIRGANQFSVQPCLLVVLFILAAVASGCCFYPPEKNYVTPGPTVRITGIVQSVQNTGDPEGICHPGDEYWVLVTDTDRYVVSSTRDPYYQEANIFDDWDQLKERAGKTAIIEGQLVSVQLAESEIVCTWLRPTAIYD